MLYWNKAQSAKNHKTLLLLVPIQGWTTGFPGRKQWGKQKSGCAHSGEEAPFGAYFWVDLLRIEFYITGYFFCLSFNILVSKKLLCKGAKSPCLIVRSARAVKKHHYRCIQCFLEHRKPKGPYHQSERLAESRLASLELILPISKLIFSRWV